MVFGEFFELGFGQDIPMQQLARRAPVGTGEIHQDQLFFLGRGFLGLGQIRQPRAFFRARHVEGQTKEQPQP